MNAGAPLTAALFSCIEGEHAMNPRRTREEFLLLLDHPELTPQELLQLLPRRSVDAIELGRLGITRFLNGQPIDGFLSQMAIRILEERFPEIAARH
jgi:hypothetical protein